MTVNPKTPQAYDLFHQGVLALARAERQGIRVDVDYIQDKKQELTDKIQDLERQLKSSNFYKQWVHVKETKPNIHSDAQLRHFLYKVKKLKPVKETATGQGSTDEEALKQLNIPELDLILEIRKYSKAKSTYLENFERETMKGYMHPVYNLHLVQTYRSSSDSPNFQNIPKRDKEIMQICRGALYPRPGHQLLEIDFSGLEVRVAACYNKDETLIRYIKNPNSDMHSDMAKQIFKVNKIDKSILSNNTLRQAAKNGFVFPQFYGDYFKQCAENICDWVKLPKGRWKDGMGLCLSEDVNLEGDWTISDHLITQGINSYDKFENHIKEIEEDFWNNRFNQYRKWKDMWWNLYQRYGYIDMLTGFRCTGIMDKKKCVNYPVQGSAFHCLLWSLIQADDLIIKNDYDSHIIGQIHDSMILDVNPFELNVLVDEIKEITNIKLAQHFDWIIVPMDVDMEICGVDESWAIKKEFKL